MLPIGILLAVVQMGGGVALAAAAAKVTPLYSKCTGGWWDYCRSWEVNVPVNFYHLLHLQRAVNKTQNPSSSTRAKIEMKTGVAFLQDSY